MSQAIYAQNVADALIAYHETVLTDPGKVINLSDKYRNSYYGQLESKRTKVQETEGKFYSLKYFINGYDNSQLDSFFKPDSISRSDLGEEGKLYTSWYKTHYAVDRREPGWGKGATASQIFDYLELQATNMMSRFYERCERYLWDAPASPNDGSTADVQPWGIPSWVVGSTTAAAGFNGIHASGFSNQPDGLSRNTYPQLKNGTATSSGVNYGDFAKKASKLLDLMQWKPVKPASTDQMLNYDYEMVSGYEPYAQYSDLLRASNDNLGADAGRYFGSATVPMGTQLFRGVIWSWCDALTSSTLPDGSTNPTYDSNLPVYLLNWSSWVNFTQSAWNKRMDKPITLDNPHNTVVQWLDHTYNIACMNPRSNAVIRTA